MSIRLHDVCWSADGREIVHPTSLGLERGHLVGLVGPNGCGKSSLMRLMAGMRRPASGRVEVDGEDLTGMKRPELARRVAFVDQLAFAQDDYTARQVIELGRAPFLGRWAPLSEHDGALVMRAIHDMGLEDLEDARWARMSGGERQRVHIARALAQNTPVIVLDEPLNHLDIHHQVTLMDRLTCLADEGRTVLVSVHDLTMAARSCDELVVMKAGRVIQTGEPTQCLTPSIVRDVFGVTSTLESCEYGRPLLALHEACEPVDDTFL